MSITTSLPRRPLGRTGVEVSALGLGGFHLGMPDLEEREAIRIIHRAMDEGVDFLDNCWDYNDGASEVRMGKALADGRRGRAFVMTKIDGRDRGAAARQIDESLRRLRTDHVDLMQFHEIIRPDDPDRIFSPGGAVEAMQEARKAGKIRFIGFSGHKSPAIHLSMLERAERDGFRFDAVQLPLNVMDAHYDSFEKKVVPALRGKGAGILAMKPMGDGAIPKSGIVTAEECLHYALNFGDTIVITGCESMERLEQALAAARTFRPMDADRVAQLLAQTADAARKGDCEPYKTTDRHDGTEANPQWLG